MTLFFANIVGWIVAHWRLVAGVVAVVVLVIGIGIIYRACNKPPKLDLQQIEKAQEAIRENDRKEMEKILVESDVREQGIDNSIKAAEEATRQAKQNYQGKSNEELAAELERRANQ